MFDWLKSASEPLQVAVVTGVIAPGITALVAVLASIFAYRTSVRIARQSDEISETIKRREVLASGNAHVATFRQEWIEKLRTAMAEYISQVVGLIHNQTGLISQEDYSKLVMKMEYIEMLLNVEEPDSAKIVSLMGEYFDLTVRPKNLQDNAAIYATRKALNKQTRLVLKTEWDRLRHEIKDYEK